MPCPICSPSSKLSILHNELRSVVPGWEAPSVRHFSHWETPEAESCRSGGYSARRNRPLRLAPPPSDRKHLCKIWYRRRILEIVLSEVSPACSVLSMLIPLVPIEFFASLGRFPPIAGISDHRICRCYPPRTN